MDASINLFRIISFVPTCYKLTASSARDGRTSVGFAIDHAGLKDVSEISSAIR